MKKYKRRYRAPDSWRGNRAAGKVIASSGYLNGRVYNFKRKLTSNLIITYNGVATESHGAYKFKLSDLPNYTEFTSLFDKYRITGIRAQFLPRVNIMDLKNVNASFTEIPPVLTVVDYDDASGTDDYASLCQYENAKIHNQFRPFSVYFKPMVAIAAYQGAFTGYSSSRKTWIDAASPSVEYYALKWATPPYSAINSIANPTYDVIFTYYIQCKYPR